MRSIEGALTVDPARLLLVGAYSHVRRLEFRGSNLRPHGY